MKKQDKIIQLQLKDASNEINKLLLDFDVVLRVDDDGNYSSFCIENFAQKEVAVNYIQLKTKE